MQLSNFFRILHDGNFCRHEASNSIHYRALEIENSPRPFLIPPSRQRARVRRPSAQGTKQAAPTQQFIFEHNNQPLI